ncbi:uncharacterized protein LOC134763618 [Penaeus indicus]|uniref:uncharacterized protein LOC134763618 n=1 Tax=Penaeus indicus TaxID=29960 RepID=UPI00300C6EFC
MVFSVENFVVNPSADLLVPLKKAQWCELAAHYEIPIRSSLRKDVIREIVLDHLVMLNVLTREDVEDNFPDATMKRRQIDLEFQKVEVEKLRAENERMRLVQRSEHDSCDSRFQLKEAVRFVPRFSEQEPEYFFAHFERIAQLHMWPQDKWVLLIDSAFIGRAQEVFSALDLAQSQNYNVVKQAILSVYKKVPEAYRQEFRNSRKIAGQTYVEFIRRKDLLCRKWVESQLSSREYEQLIELFILEEVKNCMPLRVRSHIEERGLTTLSEVGMAADNFSLTNPQINYRSRESIPHPNPSRHAPPRAVKSERGVTETSYARVPSPPVNLGQPNDGPDGKAEKILFCRYCKKVGHSISDCIKLIRKRSDDAKPVMHISMNTESITIPKDFQGNSDETNSINQPKQKIHEVNPSFLPFRSTGFIGMVGAEEPLRPVSILRDSGAELSLICKHDVPSPVCYTGEKVLVDGFTGIAGLPLCMVYLRSDFMNGPVRLGVVDYIPAKGISVIIGNDLAGGRMWPCPVVTSCPPKENNTKELELKYPQLFPACAITRSMSKIVTNSKAAESHASESDVLGDFTLKDFFKDADKLVMPANSEGIIPLNGKPVTRDVLIAEQNNDPDLAKFYDDLVDENEIDNFGNCFYLKSGVLMRKFRNLNVPSDEIWNNVHQIVVPQSLRSEILYFAHDLCGHLGVTKTYLKVLAHFFGPKLKKDVGKHCQTCHICQVKGKPGTSVKPYPLHPIPAVDEPFSKIVIDCVGPLPKTKRGNQFLLTIIDRATRYPEAVPLRRITSKNVVRVLVKFFTQVGLPSSIQSDQGSNFTSVLFQQGMRSLGITQYKSTAFHPESQGVVERFHYTLKTMIKSFCLEAGSEWDEVIDLLLFSVRESVQESLGFSPFQLIYGHEVRGPLKVLKECWLNEEVVVPVSVYVENLKCKLKTAISIAHKHLGNVQSRMKETFDKTKKAEVRTFKEGELVLALLPIHKQPLCSKYHGPFRVLKRTSEVNYVIETPERRKKKRLVHVNLLKKYHSREDTGNDVDKAKVIALIVSNTCNISEGNSDKECEVSIVVPNLSNSIILDNPEHKLVHLTAAEAANIISLLQEHRDLFSDTPRLCTLLEHDIDTTDAQPIRQAPYRLGGDKKKFLSSEVRRLQDQGLIRPSLSPWASPVVLVPKTGGPFRLCIDYRKVNAVTVPDSYPLPRMDDIIDDLGKAKYLSKLDLLQGYYQVPLSERAKPISAFVTPTGLYEFTVLPFGMRNAPATFQRLMNFLTAGLEGVRCYLDDLVVWSSSWEDHLIRLRALFSTLAEANLTVNLMKSEFGHAHVIFLGHVVGQGQLAPVAAKIEAVQQYPTPSTRKSLMRFIGLAGYYRRFCKNFAQVSTPLTDLLSTKRTFKWSPECQTAFENLKNMLTNAPVLQAPDMNKPFSIHVDASDAGIGAVLLQPGPSEVLHPVCYMSFKYKPYQKSYATVEKEALGLIVALEKFKVYLLSTRYAIEIFTDHNPLRFIESVKFKNVRVLRWALELQPYNVKITHIKGKENIIADALSRA